MTTFIKKYEGVREKSFFIYLNTLYGHFYTFKKQLILIYRNELFYIALEVFNGIFEEKRPQKFNDNKEFYALYYHIGGIYNFFILWLMHGMEETPKELSEYVISMFPLDAQPKLFS